MKTSRVHVMALLGVLGVACGGAFSRGNEEGGAGVGAGGAVSSGAKGGGHSSGGGTRNDAGASSGAAPVGGSPVTGGAAPVGGSRSTQGCEEVTCEPTRDCEEGYELSFPAGACCPGCVPQQPGGVACNEVACPQTPCPPGYVRGDVLGACCYQCLPDPLYCSVDSDCVAADKPRSCCGCPEVITRRQFETEPCWWEVEEPRSVPRSCYPNVTCDAACTPCSGPDIVACRANRCVETHYGLK